MRSIIRILMAGCAVVFLLTGCARRPTSEISAATEAVKEAVQESSNMYVKDKIDELQKDLESALSAVSNEDKKFYKRYDRAKDLLSKVKDEAELLKNVTIPNQKQEAKMEALENLEQAKTSIEEAKLFLTQAPRGKEGTADIEAFQADVEGLEYSFKKIQVDIDNENYLLASEKALSINEEANAITDQVKEALKKVESQEKKAVATK
ncbi:MAG: hypothetical protein ACMUIP_12955 [bacterium]